MNRSMWHPLFGYLVPSGSRRGVLSGPRVANPFDADVATWLPAQAGWLPENWWYLPAPSAPSGVVGLWVHVVRLLGDSNGGAGQGVLYDTRKPEQRGRVVNVWSEDMDADGTLVRVQIPNSQANFPTDTGPATEWIPSTYFDTKPKNASWRWVKITTPPATGPTIEGVPMQMGRGILFQQRGNLPRKQVGSVKVYLTRDDPRSGQGALGVQFEGGIVSLISKIDEPSVPVLPDCGPTEGLYAVGNHYFCGVTPPPYKPGIPCSDSDEQFFLPPSGGAGQCGRLIRPAEQEKEWGTWAPATFFDKPPHRFARRWVKIEDVNVTPWSYGTGILFTKFGSQQQSVLILELDSSDQSKPRARYVSTGVTGTGGGPFPPVPPSPSQPNPRHPISLRKKR